VETDTALPGAEDAIRVSTVTAKAATAMPTHNMMRNFLMTVSFPVI
jgi:hypothetical protein